MKNLGVSCSWSSIGFASVTPGDTFSEASFDHAQEWLRHCQTQHNRCIPRPPSRSRLPQRIIDVSPLDADGSVRLLETENEEGYYLCLSHCWGQSAFPVKTTKINISDWKRKIPWSALPKTFQDAISFVRRLEKRYIWIDSLCIVQGSLEDWRRESSKMAAIYQNSYLTLAVTKSMDSCGGCFSTQDASYNGHKFPGVNEDGTFEAMYCRKKIPHWWGPFYNGLSEFPIIHDHFPLLDRAWVYQERLLSPRVLHFGAQELLWECMEECRCECTPWETLAVAHPKIDHSEALKSLSLRDLGERWREIVKESSQLSLTVTSGRLAILSGIAQQMQSLRKGSYLGGLWDDTLDDFCSHRPKVRSPT